MTTSITERYVPVCHTPDADCPLTLLGFDDDRVPWRTYAIAAVAALAVGLIGSIACPEKTLEVWVIAGILLAVFLLTDISPIGEENRQDDKVHKAIRGCQTREIKVQTSETDGVTLAVSELKDVYETQRYIVAVAAYGSDGYYAYVIPKALIDETLYEGLKRLFLTVLPEGHVQYMI